MMTSQCCRNRTGHRTGLFTELAHECNSYAAESPSEEETYIFEGKTTIAKHPTSLDTDSELVPRTARWPGRS